MSTSDMNAVYADFITANHILSYHGIVDAFGHISMRVPGDPSTFLMTGSMPPALMRTADDIGIYDVETAAPISGSTDGHDSPYSELSIHAQMYEAYPDVACVVHSHAKAVVAMSNCDTDDSGRPTGILRAMWHMGGFIGAAGDVPIFDPRQLGYYEPEEIGITVNKRDLLISTPFLGGALAGCISDFELPLPRMPTHALVLQRGHGFVTWGTSLRQAVYRAVYAEENAQVQQMSEAVVRATPGARGVYLSAAEARDAKEMNDGAIVKAWPFWEAQVRAHPLYVNDLRP